ncbi:MAG: Crp/Fnr family transcriptional regulator [Planctomycetes bacterium]|nr:Crp/Fnr family transcriptional regulator [Planctomycetota bacterium]
MSAGLLLDALADLPHFRALPPDLLQRVAEGSRMVRLRADELLFSQGDPACGFYGVRSGSVRLFRMTADGREQVLQHVPAGKSFAEAALLTMGRFPANARAMQDDTELVEVGATVFLKLFREDPRLAAAMVSSLSMWLHSMVERIEELQIASAPARFARYLLRLPARDEAGALVVQLPMAKKDLATHLAIVPETLSRLLRRWQDQGIVDSRGKELAILDSRVLIAIADRESE